MTYRIYYKLLLLTICLAYTSLLKSQVTIGSGLPPMSGSLLQLKETAALGVNSTKGLALPRVKITQLDNLSDIGPNLDEAAHTGLVVYSSKENLCASKYVYQGLYIWTGTKWNFIGTQKTNAPEVHEFVDPRDSVIYRYRDFGPLAGVWMLDDMRAFTYHQGGNDPVLGIISQTTPHLGRYYCYPAPSGSGTDDSYFKKQPAIGILYSWSAAMNIDPAQGGIADPGNIEQGEQGASLLVGKQGICPNGWHIPSDKEWNDVESVIATNPELYSTNSGTSWNETWRNSDNNAWRPATADGVPGHGDSMKSGCSPASDQTATNSNGKSFLPSDGGFNILLVGDGFDNEMQNHGQIVSFWSASASGSGAAWARTFQWDNPGVFRVKYNRSRLFSVRCKAD